MRHFRSRCAVSVVLAVLAVACSDEPTAPVDSDAGVVAFSVVGPQAVSDAETNALGAAFDRVDSYVVVIVDAVTEELLVDTTVGVLEGSLVHDLRIAVPDDAFERTVTITLIAYDGPVELYRSVETTTLTADGTGPIEVQVEIRYTGPGIRGVVRDIQGASVGGMTVNLIRNGEEIVDAVTTEEDGTYLFLDVSPGAYEIVPTPRQGLQVCPFRRDVSMTAADEALVANFVATEDCVTRVLVLSGGDFDDTGAAATLLGADQELSVSTFFHVNRLPTLDFLDDFEVVVVFMNGLFDESASLGNRLAKYVAEGGNVVTASFYYQGRSDSNLGSVGWGALELLDPFTARIDPITGEGGATYETVSLDPNSVVAHPVTSFLNTLSSESFSSGVQAKADTQVLARWDDGLPLVGYRSGPAGQRLVGVSLFPVQDPTITGDVQIFWHSVVRWAGFAPPIEG